MASLRGPRHWARRRGDACRMICAIWISVSMFISSSACAYVRWSIFLCYSGASTLEITRIGYGARSKLAIKYRAQTLAELKVKALESDCQARTHCQFHNGMRLSIWYGTGRGYCVTKSIVSRPFL